MRKIKRVICSILTLAMLFLTGVENSTDIVYAASTITGNNSIGSAYNCGSWTSINNISAVILDSGEQESWFKFTVGAEEKIYIRVSSDDEYEGMKVSVIDDMGMEVSSKINPNDLMPITNLTSGLYVNIDNDSSTTSTYYLVIERGTVYMEDMYCTVSAYNRIKSGSGTFTFSGTASNAGNSSLSTQGVNSSIISINLNNSGFVPKNAVVTNVRTKGTQSPRQGNVHHMIKPSSASTWYTSTVSSADSGSYNIVYNNKIYADQKWEFRYNAMATAKSTMKNVTLILDYEYDIANTGYKTFIK